MKKFLIGFLSVFMTFNFAVVAMAATTTTQINNPHQNFAVNTDGCASCHTTHTAVGPKLLSGPSTYVACTNCHDGTESVYDVKLGKVGTTDAISTTTYDAIAGLFVGNATVGMANSRHIADSGTGIDMANLGSNGSYTGTNIFTCAGCHDPHKKLSDFSGNGTVYNARLLRVAPKVIYKEDAKAVLNAVAGAPGAGTASIVKSADSNSILSAPNGYMDVYPMKSILYTRTGAASPYTYTEVNSNTYTFNASTGVFTINSGFSATNTYVASYYPKASLVTINYTNNRATSPSSTLAETATYPDTNLNLWCATCHNDYGMSRDAKVTSGDYSTKYRHAVSKSDQGLAAAAKTATFLPKINGTAIASASNIYLPVTNQSPANILCITCHFPHGTKAKSIVTTDSVTINTSGGTQASWTNSSKLLRYDNRDTCESCHQK